MLIGGHEFRCRPRTNDDHICHEVLIQNTYRLPPAMRDWVVVDLGAHIGAFSLACLDRGAARVFSVEPEGGNMALARAHLAPYGERVSLAQLAIVRSDVEAAPSRMQPYHYMAEAGLYNTGSPSSFAVSGPVVESMAFDALVRLVRLEDAAPIDWLKIDAQSSEWPILLTSQRLDAIRTLVGEFEELACLGGHRSRP